MTTELERQEGVGASLLRPEEERLEGIKEELEAARVVTRKSRKRRKLEAMCDEYLLSLHCTLWGQPFEIISPKGRAQAVAWLADTIEAMVRIEAKEPAAFKVGSAESRNAGADIPGAEAANEVLASKVRQRIIDSAQRP